MQPLRYSLNLTLDGCVDHTVGIADPELHRHATGTLARAGALIFGRITYGMMEGAFRGPGSTGVKPEGMADWMMPFARTIDAAPKYVVSDTLAAADWNAKIIRGENLADSVRALKAKDGPGLYTGGVTLPLALAALGLIDAYEFIVHPRIAGHGPTLFAGLPHHLDLTLTAQHTFASGAIALSYVPR